MAEPKSLEERVMDALGTVMDPELHQDLVTLKMVKSVVVEGGRVRLDVELTTPACPLKDKIEADVRRAVGQVPGVGSIDLAFSARVRSAVTVSGRAPIPGIANVVAVASGKGGVGKSTVAVNLAVALAQTTARVGLLDCDIYGPSVPKLLGLPTRAPEGRDGKIAPFEIATSGGLLKVMSMAFFLQDDQPVVWRGPMLHKVLQQFLHDVAWGELDYLVIDLPPGTGDVQLSLSQTVPLTGAVIVTTPQEVALLDVRKAVSMFGKVGVPILGIVENMASFACTSCGAEHAVFGSGGGEALAREIKAPLLGSVPLDVATREGGDLGLPAVAAKELSPAGRALVEVARAVAAQVSIRAREGGFAVELPVI